MATNNTTINALVGAVVTVVLSFIPFSPLLGGGVAGFMEERDGARIGMFAGVIASVPLFLLLVLIGSVVAFVPVPGASGGRNLIVAALLVVFFLLGYVVVLSAVGGVVGVYLAAEVRE